MPFSARELSLATIPEARELSLATIPEVDFDPGRRQLCLKKLRPRPIVSRRKG